MRDFILENLNSETISWIQVLENNVAAIIVAIFIMIAYRLTFSGTAYSRRFNVSLGAITIITTMIMSVISNNVALSLGMVGALSIIRFRTAVKDVRDAVYIFWSIAVGIGCGVSQYVLVGIGSLVLFIFLMITGKSVNVDRQLLIVQASPEAQNEIESIIEEHFGKAAHRLTKNISLDQCEVVYSIREGALNRADKKAQIDISQRLMRVHGAIRVSLVEQQDTISR